VSDRPHLAGDFTRLPPSSWDEGGRSKESPAGDGDLPQGAPRRGSSCPSPSDDAELVARVRAGETEAYRPLVERYQRAALGLAARLLGSGGDAEDLAQEAFVRAFRYLGSLKEPERFGPWLFQVVRSLCRDRNRRREAEKRALERRKELLAWDSVPNGEGVGSELYRLPPAEYQALRLRYFDGLNYEEIARRMDKSFSQVDHLIRKARAHLARKIIREKEREL